VIVELLFIRIWRAWDCPGKVDRQMSHSWEGTLVSPDDTLRSVIQIWISLGFRSRS
jgi:hypothetical protein